MYNENELIRAAIDRKIRESLAQQGDTTLNPVDKLNGISNKLDSIGSGLSTAGDYLTKNTALTKLGTTSKAVGGALQQGASKIAPSVVGSSMSSTAGGAAMGGPIGALIALGAMAVEGTNRKRAKQAGEQAQQLAEGAIEARKSALPNFNPAEQIPATAIQNQPVEQTNTPVEDSLSTILQAQPVTNPETERRSAFSNLANGLDDFLAGYKENKTQGFDANNLKPSDKGVMQRLGEGVGTVARISQHPIVQGVVAGGLSGLLSGDPLYGLSSAYKYANSKYKADLFKDILSQQGIDVGNNNGMIDANDLSKILVSRRFQKDFMSRGEYDRFRLDNGELGIDDYNSLINSPEYNPNEMLNITGLENIAKANRYKHQNNMDKINNFMTRGEYDKLRLDNDLISPEEYEEIISNPDYKADDIVNISGLNAVSKAGKYMQDNKNSRSQNYWRNQNKGQNVVRVEYGEKPDSHNYTHVTYGDKPENKSTTYVRYENKPQSQKPATKPKPSDNSKTKAPSTERVRVKDKNGNSGTIPKNYLLDALKEGYKLITGN